jgi:hypothetical protein
MSRGSAFRQPIKEGVMAGRRSAPGPPYSMVFRRCSIFCLRPNTAALTTNSGSNWPLFEWEIRQFGALVRMEPPSATPSSSSSSKTCRVASFVVWIDRTSPGGSSDAPVCRPQAHNSVHLSQAADKGLGQFGRNGHLYGSRHSGLSSGLGSFIQRRQQWEDAQKRLIVSNSGVAGSWTHERPSCEARLPGLQAGGNSFLLQSWRNAEKVLNSEELRRFSDTIQLY